MSSFSDVEHFSNMVAGCESINAGKPNSEEGRYARSVLRLYTADFGAVAGQEGFLENIKAGAQKTGEFIKKLFEAIKKWFSEVFKTTKGKFASFMKSGDDKEREARREKARGLLVPKIEALKAAAGKVPEGVNAKGFSETADKAIAALNGTAAAAVITDVNALLDAVTRVSDSFISYSNGLMPKKQMDSHAPYDKAIKEYKAWAEKANALTNGLTALYQSKVNSDQNK